MALAPPKSEPRLMDMTRLLAPFQRLDTYRALAFYAAQLGLGAVGFAVVIAGWSITLALAITPLVVPLLIGFRAAVGGLAHAQAAAARNLLGASTHASLSFGGRGFWARGFGVLRDAAFWKQQVHLVLSWPAALIPLSLLGWSLELLTLPVWYRWVDGEDVLGFITVDRFVETLPVAAAGLVLLVVLAHLLGPMASLSRRLATGLLGGDAETVARTAAETRARRLQALTLTSLISTSVVLMLVVVWALTTPGDYFWPIWPLLSIALVVGAFGWIVAVLENSELPRLALGSPALAIQIGLSAALAGFLLAVWAVTTPGGYVWPVWPALGLALLAACHAAVAFGLRQHRIERLEQTRAGAVDLQETELRRIERDLHDGAQARLVSLGMSLGLAEQALQTDPGAARELLAEARRGAGEALEELRVLARGIRPPILTDRGLEPAISALIARAALPVTLSVDVSRRFPSAWRRPCTSPSPKRWQTRSSTQTRVASRCGSRSATELSSSR